MSDLGVMLWFMPRTVRLDGLGELLEKQFAVVSREQLLTLGMADRAMQYRVRAGGPWQVLLPGVYLGVTGTPNLPQKEMAALLYGGPGSLITGPVALMHYGIRSAPALDTIEVLVPATRQRANTGFVRLHRTARMPGQIAASGPVRFAPVARAVADTAWQQASLNDVRAVVAGAVQLGRCTVSQLASELQSGPVRGSAMFRTVLSEVADGVRSVAEGDFRDLIKAVRLPMPLFNPSLYVGDTFIARPDAWWPEAGVVAEVDSREWHLGPADHQRTTARHDLMGEAGIIPLHFLPSQIRREPAMVAQRIRGALANGRMRPPLPIRTIPCPESRPRLGMVVAPCTIDCARCHNHTHLRQPGMDRYRRNVLIWDDRLGAWGTGSASVHAGRRGEVRTGPARHPAGHAPAGHAPGAARHQREER
jgi:hypothetical protein